MWRMETLLQVMTSNAETVSLDLLKGPESSLRGLPKCALCSYGVRESLRIFVKTEIIVVGMLETGGSSVEIRQLGWND